MEAIPNKNFSSNSDKERNVKQLEDPINNDEVEVVVKRALGSTFKLIDYNIGSYSKKISGYLGSHLSLTVNVKRENDNGLSLENHKFFIKAIPYDIEERTVLIEENKYFFKETHFYEHIAPELIKSSIDRSWMAECYLINKCAMVFEDLKLKSFTIKPKVLEMKYLKSALASIAKLHASSILSEKRMGKTFLQVYPDYLIENVFVKRGKSKDWFDSGVEVIESIVKSIDLDPARVSNVLNRIFKTLEPSPKWQNVICHADPWSYNLMFDDSQPLPKCVLVDYQGVRYAPASSDLLQFLYTTTRREFREKNEKDLLRYYNDMLRLILKNSNENVVIPTFEETWQEYQDLRVIGITTACLYFPFILIDENCILDLLKENYSNVVFNKRDHLVLDMMEKDPLLKERLREIATELVQKSNDY